MKEAFLRAISANPCIERSHVLLQTDGRPFSGIHSLFASYGSDRCQRSWKYSGVPPLKQSIFAYTSSNCTVYRGRTLKKEHRSRSSSRMLPHWNHSESTGCRTKNKGSCPDHHPPSPFTSFRIVTGKFLGISVIPFWIGYVLISSKFWKRPSVWYPQIKSPQRLDDWFSIFPYCSVRTALYITALGTRPS